MSVRIKDSRQNAESGCVSVLFKAIKGLLLATVYSIAWALIIGFPVMWVWNWIIPYLFDLPHISFWQSWGILFLSAALFKSNTFTHKPKEPAKDNDKYEPSMKVSD